MTLSKYISELREALPKDRLNISDRLIIELINQYRAIQIKNDLNKLWIIPSELVQSIVVDLNISNQSLGAYDTKLRIMKGYQNIPNIINLTNRALITSVSSPAILGSQFNIVSKDRAKYVGNGSVNKKDIFCFIDYNSLYLKLKIENPNINLITTVYLEAIFEDPTELFKDPHNYNNEYPLTKTMWGYIKSSILSNSFNIVKSNEEE